MSNRFPLDEDSVRPYSFLHEPQPEWFINALKEGLASTLLVSHLVAMELYVAEMSDEKLKATFAEALSLTEDERCFIMCNVELETVPLLETVKAEMGYRQSVGSRKQKSLLVH